MTQQFGNTDDELATMPLTFRDGLFAGQVGWEGNVFLAQAALERDRRAFGLRFHR